MPSDALALVSDPPPGRARTLAVAVGLALFVAPSFAACGSGTPAASERQSITVLAAASLTEAFEVIGADFEALYPEMDVSFSFGGSQQLAAQIEQGAPADVFASANQAQMDRVVGAGLAAADPRVFARNRLAIAVERGNPLSIKGLADLDRDGLLLVLAAPEVPAGQYAAEILERAGVQAKPVSLENDVRSVLSKVDLGEADAGIVYVTDAASAGAIDLVHIPEQANVVATYPIAALRDAPNPAGAAAFVDYVLSPAGAEVLRTIGFSVP